jgi:hypothetical protein
MKNILLIFLALSFIFISCKKDNKDEKTSHNSTKKTYKVSYEIGCTDCEVIYYKDSLEAQASEYHKNSTWSYNFYARKGQAVVLLAYNTSGTPQGVTATIKVNDIITQTQTNYCPISGDAFVVDSIK